MFQHFYMDIEFSFAVCAFVTIVHLTYKVFLAYTYTYNVLSNNNVTNNCKLVKYILTNCNILSSTYVCIHAI